MHGRGQQAGGPGSTAEHDSLDGDYAAKLGSTPSMKAASRPPSPNTPLDPQQSSSGQTSSQQSSAAASQEVESRPAQQQHLGLTPTSAPVKSLPGRPKLSPYSSASPSVRSAATTGMHMLADASLLSPSVDCQQLAQPIIFGILGTHLHCQTGGCRCTGAEGVAKAARGCGSERSSASSGSREAHAREGAQSKPAQYLISADGCRSSDSSSMEQPANEYRLDRHACIQVTCPSVSVQLQACTQAV